jgi:transcriptional antiterminator NusG
VRVSGGSAKPTPITQKKSTGSAPVQEGASEAASQVLFEMGEAVRVKDGPFTDFTATWRT